ncbi:MAG: rod shape-determining protein MreC [Ruminococcaceae bacterium]|nr:rod shape-determining protein MreC [Oscillospiraceae bacterium]
MMNLFKNKFFIICLTVAVVLCAVPSVFSVMGYKSLSRDMVGIITTPFRWIGTGIANAFEGFERFFTSVEKVNEENEALREKNRLLLEELERSKILEEENQRLREYLGMKTKYPSFTFEEGMVLSRSSGNYVTGYTLNRGTLHGVDVNMAVVTNEGVVGFVSEVGSTWCKVSTILESESSVGAYIPRSGDVGIVCGDLTLGKDGACKFSYVESDADIQVGDRILSSGVASFYPPELSIGVVESIQIDEYSRATTATVRPSVDFSNLKYMLIVTGYGE